MYKKILMLFAIALVFAGCDREQTPPDCAPQSCTMEFRSIVVKYTDKQGHPVIVQDFEAVNLRTQKPLKNSGPVDPANFPGNYTVVSDSNLKELSNDGDEIVVTAKNPQTGQVKTITVKASGGCQCHVAKISGPEQVQFD